MKKIATITLVSATVLVGCTDADTRMTLNLISAAATGYVNGYNTRPEPIKVIDYPRPKHIYIDPTPILTPTPTTGGRYSIGVKRPCNKPKGFFCGTR